MVTVSPCGESIVSIINSNTIQKTLVVLITTDTNLVAMFAIILINSVPKVSNKKKWISYFMMYMCLILDI